MKLNDQDALWWQDARFGMMIHWGLYSLLGGVYQGQKMDYIGEWIQSRYRIPKEEYESLVTKFNPTSFDAKRWVALAKEAGMGYLIFTAKHHEGFAMYHSLVDSYNIYDATPFARDPLAELAKECRSQGIRLGIYYSQSLDWHDKDAGGCEAGHTNFGMSWTNDWDYPDNEKKNFDRYFERKALPQIEELVTRYGEISLFWFDTPLSISKKQCQTIYDLVKRHQPHCLINSRLGNGLGDYESLGDNMIPDALKEGRYEVAATMNDTWGYKSFDHHYKKSKDIILLLTSLAGKGINYLLNVGPDGKGAFPPESETVLKEIGVWMKRNGYFLHHTSPCPLLGNPIHGAITSSQDSLNLCLYEPKKNIVLNGILSPVAQVEHEGRALPFTQSSDSSHSLTIDVSSIKKEFNPVLRIRFMESPHYDRRLIEQGSGIALKAKDGTLREMSERKHKINSSFYQVDGTQASLAKPTINPIGSYAGWLVPNVELSWDFVWFHEKKVDLSLLFLDFVHSHSLSIHHEVKIILDGTLLYQGAIQKDEDATNPISPYYQAGRSNLVSFMIQQGAHHLVVRPTKIDGKDQIGFCLAAVELKSTNNLIHF